MNPLAEHTRADVAADEAGPTAVDAGARRRVWLVAAALSLAALAVGALVTVGGEGAGPEAAPRNQAAVVHVVAAERGDLPLRLEVRGELVADAADLAAQSSGYLVDVVVALGDRVEKGALLARVETSQAEREIAEARAQALAAEASRKRAKAQLAAAERELERANRALEKGLISEQDAAARSAQVDLARAEVAAAEAQIAESRARIELSRERLRDTELIAPFDGAVAARYLDQGTMVQPGTVVLRLVKAGPLTVRFRIPERDLGRVAEGATFEVTTQATGDARHRGVVERVAAEVARLDRSVAVEGLLEANDPGLRPGMYAVVELALGTLEDAVVIPRVALLERIRTDASDASDAMQTGVFVVRDGRAHFTPVTVTAISGDRAAVQSLAAGDAVVVVGHALLRNEAPVRVVEPGAPP